MRGIDETNLHNVSHQLREPYCEVHALYCIDKCRMKPRWIEKIIARVGEKERVHAVNSMVSMIWFNLVGRNKQMSIISLWFTIKPGPVSSYAMDMCLVSIMASKSEFLDFLRFFSIYFLFSNDLTIFYQVRKKYWDLCFESQLCNFSLEVFKVRVCSNFKFNRSQKNLPRCCKTLNLVLVETFCKFRKFVKNSIQRRNSTLRYLTT